MGLQKLPGSVIMNIMCRLRLMGRSYLRLRLVCRAFRDAYPFHREYVKVSLCDTFVVKAPASPEMLALLRAQETTLGDLKSLCERLKLPDANWLQVAEEMHQAAQAYVGSLSRQAQSMALVCESRFPYPSPCAVLSQELFAMLPKFVRLTSIHLYGEVEEQTTGLLSKLQHLKCITMSSCPGLSAVMSLHVPALASLDLGSVGLVEDRSEGYPVSPEDENRIDYQQMLTYLASTCTGLKSLALPCPASAMQELTRLSALPALTYLHVRTWGVGSLLGLTRLTLLEILRLDAIDWISSSATFEDLACLASMTRLASLGLAGTSGGLFLPSSPEFQVLSRLSALREIRIRADRLINVERDPLPGQLQFLRQATALENFHLCINDELGECVSMPPATVNAIRQVVSGLERLSRIFIRITQVSPRKSLSNYDTLSCFTSAPSVRELAYDIVMLPQALTQSHKEWRMTLDSIKDAKTCLSCLTALQSLSLGGRDLRKYYPAPNCLNILKGLSSTNLTSLRVRTTKTTGSIMRQIASCSSLQYLCLSTNTVDQWAFRALKGMTNLTKLVLHLPGSASLDWAGIDANVFRGAGDLKEALEKHWHDSGFVPEIQIEAAG